MSVPGGLRRGRRRKSDLVAGSVTAVLVLLLAGVAALSTNGLPFLPQYRLHALLPAGAPPVRVGTDVRSLGRHAGVVTAVRRRGVQQAVTLRLTVHPAGRDARVTVRLKSPAGGRFLDVDLGDTRAGTLPGGAWVDPKRVTFTEDFPTVVSDFSARALRDAEHGIGLTGNGLLGRGGDLNRAAAGAGTTLRRTTSVLHALTPGRDLPAVTRGTAGLADALRGRARGDIAGFVTSNADLLGAFADPATRFDELLSALPPAERSARVVLPEADAVLRDATRLSRGLRATVAALDAALPATRRLTATGPTLRRTTARLVAVATPALRAAAPVLRRLGPPAALLARTMPPLGALSAYLATFRSETQHAVAAYWGASMYHAPLGNAPGSPAVPAMLIVTCSRGTGAIDPKPGVYMNERMDRPCR